MRAQSLHLFAREAAVLMDTECIMPSARRIKRFERPDEIEPVLRRSEDVDLACLVGRSDDRRRSEYARANHVAIPCHPHAVTKLLPEMEDKRAWRHSEVARRLGKKTFARRLQNENTANTSGSWSDNKASRSHRRHRGCCCFNDANACFLNNASNTHLPFRLIFCGD